MTAFDAARLAAVISPLRRALLAATRAAARLPELPDAQIDVIRALPRGTARGPAEIAAQLRLSRPTVSNLLGTMEAARLVERTSDPSDGRRVLVQASDRALDLFARFDAASAAILTQASSMLNSGERAILADALPVLERLSVALSEADAAASDAPTAPEETSP
ncbi:MarR family winged helix-turn-helix transcriptional regulator [Microbacterium sp. LWH12-1.2]|uniref:MarR family winged helix-turn-helix transcriptional regulator n=1 Tax=Microbacterium sp. LWH12-1.2 TaxID=3135259 RepID=UPI00343E0E6C